MGQLGLQAATIHARSACYACDKCINLGIARNNSSTEELSLDFISLGLD